MDNNNPAEMSNDDLEKDMEQKNLEAKMAGNQEHVQKSSASEGSSLLTPESDPNSIDKINSITGGEKNPEPHEYSQSKEAESKDGSMPDPEELKFWESKDDPDKVSS